MPETTKFKLPYPTSASPADVPADLKALAERSETLFGAVDLSQLVVPGSSNGKLVIVNSGAAAYKAMSGDGTIDQNGNFQLGSKVVGTAELGDEAVTGAKVDDGTLGRSKLAADAKPVRWYPPLVIEASQSRESSVYGPLTGTSDRIEGVEVPAGGIVLVGYTAGWENTVNQAGRAAIFIDSSQLRIYQDTGNIPTQAAVGGAASGNVGNRIVTFPAGLVSGANLGTYVGLGELEFPTALALYFGESQPYAIEVGGSVKSIGTKGAPVGGFCAIQGVSAGTHTISVQYRALEGKVSAKFRRLMVGVIG